MKLPMILLEECEKRSTAVRKRPSTVAAKMFFQNWNYHENDARINTSGESINSNSGSDNGSYQLDETMEKFRTYGGPCYVDGDGEVNMSNYSTVNNWQSLPGRLDALVRSYINSSEHESLDRFDEWCHNGTLFGRNIISKKDASLLSESEGRKSLCIALTASITFWAPRDFWDEWRKLFQEILSRRVKLWEETVRLNDTTNNSDYDLQSPIIDSTSIMMEEDKHDIDSQTKHDHLHHDKYAHKDDSHDSNNYYSEEEEQEQERKIEQEIDQDLLFQNLHTIQWLPIILSKSLGRAIHDTIQSYTKHLIKGNYDDPNLLSSLHQWKDQVLLPFIHLTTQQSELVPNDHDYDNNHQRQTQWNQRLCYHISESYCRIRMEEIFDIVADYPDSLPAITELGIALHTTKMHNQIGYALRDAFDKRLLHPGAQTNQILQVYINAVKVLQLLEQQLLIQPSHNNDSHNPTYNINNANYSNNDKSSTLLNTVTSRIRAYLRGRSDTVRCIITSLTDEETGGDLYEELQRNDARPLEQAKYDSDDDEEPPDLNWQPPPSPYFPEIGSFHNDIPYDTSTMHEQTQAIAEIMTKHAHSGNGSDILSMLVGIYGSEDLFVDEYRVMLADKLLSNINFDTEKEIHNLELLKLRFGENSMRQCEIMIKDMEDSKRINANIQSTLQSSNQQNPRSNKDEDEVKDITLCPIGAAIVSHIFWPALQKDSLKTHPRIQAHLEKFSNEYAKLKNPRRLVWLQQLGQVTIDLEVIDLDVQTNNDLDEKILHKYTTKEFICSPLQATLIFHFEDRDQWSASSLSNETGVPEPIIRKRMGYWINQRVIQIAHSNTRTGDGSLNNGGDGIIYELVSSRDLSQISQQNIDISHNIGEVYEEEDEGEGIAVSLGAQEAEEMQTYVSYITGMLSNLGELPLERVHNMLKMFVSGTDHRYNKTPQQLRVFLQQMCKDEKIEFSNGVYKILKK